MINQLMKNLVFLQQLLIGIETYNQMEQIMIDKLIVVGTYFGGHIIMMVGYINKENLTIKTIYYLIVLYVKVIKYFINHYIL